MTEILKPQSGDTIYDPTCGSAGMLISCIQYIQDHGQEWRNVSVYGQEINNLTSAIGRMNLFLHGVKDFHVVNGDTLKDPAFIEHGKLKTFDVVLANPPYSISQWDREAFSADKYGRNFLGVPTQRRADFAFIQHILASMDPINGRCAILLPHGVLNRYEEQCMRENLVKRDLVDCVIGVGRNLFYNSPMEACILICRNEKTVQRKNKVLFINAVNLVNRVGTESFLSGANILEISQTYEEYREIPGFSAIATQDEILERNSSLSISLYTTGINDANDMGDYEKGIVNEYDAWQESSVQAWEALGHLQEMVGGEKEC